MMTVTQAFTAGHGPIPGYHQPVDIVGATAEMVSRVPGFLSAV